MASSSASYFIRTPLLLKPTDQDENGPRSPPANFITSANTNVRLYEIFSEPWFQLGDDAPYTRI